MPGVSRGSVGVGHVLVVRRQRAAPTISILFPVKRQQRRQMGAAARVDQINTREVPARDAHADPDQGAVSGGQLVTDALDGEGTVAQALLSSDLHPERAP